MDDVVDRLVGLSIAIIELFGRLPRGPAMRQIGLAAVRTAGSAGDSCREGRSAKTSIEFIGWVRAAARKMAECLYWLSLVETFARVSVEPLRREADAIIGLLLTSGRTARLRSW